LIDGKAAFLDTAIFGLCMAVMIGFTKGMNIGSDSNSIWIQVLLTLLVAVFSGAAVGLFVLIVSGATDSLTRAVWSKKLRSASLVRLGAFRNVFVGRALLRGTSLAFVLLGLVAGFLFLFSGAVLYFQESEFLDELTWQPMAWRAAVSSLHAYLVLALVLLGVGTFVYRFRKQAGFVVGAVVVTMALLQGAPVEFEPVIYDWLISALWGAALGLAYWHFDFLTCFTGFALADLIWSLNEGWLVEGSPAGLDVWLVGLFVIGLVVLGVFGVASGETRRAASEYVPTYITELKHQERLKSELDVARQVQESFLPRRMPNVAGLDIAAMCLAAYEVGGDYYDFVEVGPGKLAVVVGDVSGKGTQAAFYMTLTKGILQTLSREGLSPAEVMRRLNMLFYANAPRGTFISMIYGVFDVEARTFTFARAGHNPVILKRSPSQEPDLVQPTGMAIGLVAGPTFDDTIEERTLDLRIGDVLVFYTDGFSEAMNAAKDQYGDDRLARKVGDVGNRSATEILHAVAEDVHHFVGAADRHDDMTMVVVKLDRSTAHIPAVSDRQRVVAEA
ncbi:MAG: PP2C family protein-serine/threonine phosphatase, partial [Rhodothermales bacterium]